MFDLRDFCGVLGIIGVLIIGVVVVMNNLGFVCVMVGVCCDFMLGVCFIDGFGDIVSNGGCVMKNVMGYDLVKLMFGSYGILGVLIEVSFKVLLIFEMIGVLLMNGLLDVDVVVVMSVVLGLFYEVIGVVYV